MALHLITGYAGKEHITSSDQGSFNLATLGNGQFVMDRGNKFSASIQTNNTIRILDGDLLMQGRHVRLKENTYEDINFENGTQGMKRHDLVVARYSKNPSSGIESVSFVPIKGTNSESDPEDPTYTVGDITEQSGDLENDFPLYRVIFEGLTLTQVVPLFSIIPTIKNQYDELKQKVDEAIEQTLESGVATTLEEANAASDPHTLVGTGAFNALNQSVVAENSQRFQFAYDSNSGKYGYKVSEGAGADTFFPFTRPLSELIGSNVTATAGSQILTGYTAYGKDGVKLTGSMANKGAVTGSITTSGGSYTIPAGYHNGSGKVTGPTLAGLVGSNVTATNNAHILSGYTAYGKNGVKYTGSTTLATLVGSNVTATAASQISSGVTAYGKNGTKLTGTHTCVHNARSLSYVVTDSTVPYLVTSYTPTKSCKVIVAYAVNAGSDDMITATISGISGATCIASDTSDRQGTLYTWIGNATANTKITCTASLRTAYYARSRMNVIELY